VRIVVPAARGGLSHTCAVKEADLALMRLIDELHLERPFYGARKIAVVLSRCGHAVGRKRVTRLMRLMGIETIYRKPNLSRRHPQHKIYPYLLRNLSVERVHQVWSCDITYIPMKQGFLCLVAVIDWYSRVVLSWRLSNVLGLDPRMDKTFCVEALQEALDRYGKPEIFNTDQGVQFTWRSSRRFPIKASASAWTAKAAVLITSSASVSGAA
jgi:putative transposase